MEINKIKMRKIEEKEAKERGYNDKSRRFPTSTKP